jgi:hypothetical protein
VQKRRHSLLEACLGTAIGFGIAYTANALVMPWMGFRITPHENLVYTTIFTVISVVRSYFVRRGFNWMHVRGWL